MMKVLDRFLQAFANVENNYCMVYHSDGSLDTAEFYLLLFLPVDG